MRGEETYGFFSFCVDKRYDSMYCDSVGTKRNSDIMDEEYYTWVHDPEITESDARDDGYHAYQHGLSCHDNPYNNNDEWDLHVAWSEGWSRAGWDD